MVDTYQALSSLRTMLRAQRERHKERLAKGVEIDTYREVVGRCKELEIMIERVSEQIKQVNGGDEDEPDREL